MNQELTKKGSLGKPPNPLKGEQEEGKSSKSFNPENQGSDNLPAGWKWVKLGEVCEVIMGQSPPSITYNYEGVGLPFFQGKAEFTELYPIVVKWCSAPNKIAEPNDVLLSVRAPVGTTNIANQKCCIGRGLAAIRYENYKYIFYFLKSIEQQLDKKGTGTTFRAISSETVRTTKIPLPPLPEQQAIVAKIEELLSDLENGKQQLLTAQKQSKTYRQSLLKWAFEGKLNPLTPLTGGTRMEDEKAPPVKEAGEVSLPVGWKWVKLGDVVLKQTLKALPKDYPNTKFIGMDCIEPHTLKPSFTYMFSEFKSSGNYFKTGQVLYGRMRPYLNKVYRAEYDGTCSGEFIILQCKENFNPDLLKYILHAREFVSFANHKTNGDRPRISYDEIADYPIALAPIQEQQTIVEILESKLTVCDKIEETIKESLKKAETLRQSILKKAFEGKLVKID